MGCQYKFQSLEPSGVNWFRYIIKLHGKHGIGLAKSRRKECHPLTPFFTLAVRRPVIEFWDVQPLVHILGFGRRHYVLESSCNYLRICVDRKRLVMFKKFLGWQRMIFLAELVNEWGLHYVAVLHTIQSASTVFSRADTLFHSDINNDKISISSQPSRQLHRLLQYAW